MNYIKKLGISMLISIGMMLMFTLFITLFSYFNILKEGGISTLKIITPILSFLVGGITFGKKANQKGWLEGTKLGLLLCIFLIIFNYLAFDFHFATKNMLYYIILIIGSVLGSMIGINRKKKEEN
jgi:putative membrane protein (TIGR04086 family)